jgi:hydrogenase maturation factor
MNSIRQRFENIFGETELITRGGYDTAFKVRGVDVYVDKEAGEYIFKRHGITVDGLDERTADKFLKLLAE